jgi:hypothetical protein
MGHATDFTLAKLQHLLNFYSKSETTFRSFQANPDVTIQNDKVQIDDDMLDYLPKLLALIKKSSLSATLDATPVEEKNISSLSESNIGKILGFLSIDFAVSTDKKLYILEVNDRPLSFPEKKYNLPSFRNGAAFLISTLLVLEAADKPIAIVLPDKAILDKPIRNPKLLKVQDTGNVDEINLKRISQISLLLQCISKLNGNVLLCTSKMLSIKKNRVYLSGEECGACFSYSSLFPNTSLNYQFQNDSRAKVVCTDKLETYNILAESIGKDFLPQTFSVDKSKEFYDFLNNHCLKGAPVFIKNRFGTSSIGAKKVSAEYILKNIEKLDKDTIVQEYIHLDAVQNKSAGYQYDITAFLIHGEPFGISVNLAAAPSSGNNEEPLQYLTGFGQKLKGSSDIIPDELLLKLLDLSKLAVKGIYERIDPIRHEDVLPLTEKYLKRLNLPGFKVKTNNAEEE